MAAGGRHPALRRRRRGGYVRGDQIRIPAGARAPLRRRQSAQVPGRFPQMPLLDHNVHGRAISTGGHAFATLFLLCMSPQLACLQCTDTSPLRAAHVSAPSRKLDSHALCAPATGPAARPDGAASSVPCATASAQPRHVRELRTLKPPFKLASLKFTDVMRDETVINRHRNSEARQVL